MHSLIDIVMILKRGFRRTIPGQTVLREVNLEREGQARCWGKENGGKERESKQERERK